ncbi:MAG: amino acid ABC transporter permease [Alphaproteobacteria bacterium]|nr:amino acid ABC transporter permease [Alphaproteobacteria bacterium]
MSQIRNACLLIGIAFLLAGCSANWGWYVISPETETGRNNLLFLIGGFRATIELSITAFGLSLILGLIFSLMGLYGVRALRTVSRTYVELFRSVPSLVLIFWVYYGLPIALGIKLEPFMAGVLALAFAESAFIAEILRAGVQSVGRGQEEAADAIGLNFVDKIRFVIMPQAVRRVLPPLGNQFVYMLKMSALVSVIGLEDLMRRANELSTSEYRPLEIYSFLVLEYLILVMIVSAGVRWLERKMGSDERIGR